MNFFHHTNSLHHNHKLSTKDRLSDISHDPFMGWTMIFGLFIVVSIALVFVGVLSYRNVGQIFSTPRAVPSATLIMDVKELDRALSQFELRANERTAILRGYTGPSDPAASPL
jgi:hypothetical protein